MEKRTNVSPQSLLAKPISRIKQDLSRTRIDLKEHSYSEGGPNMLKRALAPNAKPRVCVIGAGVAGLRCADFLLQKGFSVTIFEARDRFGGRVGFGTTILIHLILISHSFGKPKYKDIL